MNKTTLSWVAQIVVAIIMGQTLFFKFTDAPETVKLFAQLGQGALAYKTIGFLELIACVLILVRPTITLGAVLSMGLMSGAIMAHVTKVGFAGDHGVLGGLAILTWILSALVLFLRREQVITLIQSFKSKLAPK